MAECPRPQIRGDTTQAVFDLAADAMKALDKCNNDKAALRAWAVGVETDAP